MINSIDNTTSYLFSDYPRNAGNPYQTLNSIIKDEQHFERFISINNGLRDVYICTQPLYGPKNDLNGRGIDKVFFDIDNNSDISATKALLITKILYQELRYIGVPVIPIASGRKGYHLYIPFEKSPLENTKSSIRDLRQKLYNAAVGLLLLVFKKMPNEIDRKVFGDIRRLSRVPNTLRPPDNINYCTYLPDEFIDFSIDDINKHLTKTHTYKYNYGPVIAWDEFEDVQIPSGFLPQRHINIKMDMIDRTYQCDTNSYNYKTIKSFVRPCLYKFIIQPNPDHFVRMAVAKDLLQSFSIKHIVEMFRGLNWLDWNEQKTINQLNSLVGAHPYSCYVLRREGIPLRCCIC